MSRRLVLVHSPLVGPYTWEAVADALRGRGTDVHLPELANPTEGSFWLQHARSVAGQLDDLAEDSVLVLAGHSGAGALLSAIAWELKRPVSAYLFVDAGLPHGGEPRMRGQFAEHLRNL